MKIKLTHDTAVRFRKGDVLEVEEAEADDLAPEVEESEAEEPASEVETSELAE